MADIQAMRGEHDAEVSSEGGEGGCARTRLVVFSDDWGRHPSSCQHLVGELLGRVRGVVVDEVLWVNTVGTRVPGLCVADLARGLGKLRDWVGGGDGSVEGCVDKPGGLTVINPKMWPGFRRHWQRRLNAGTISGAVNGRLRQRVDGEKRVAITTLPITADLVGRLDVDRWVYYCVDDFSVWPGLDSGVMRSMERELVGRVDEVVAVSEPLRERIAGMGRDARLLTHGIHSGHWLCERDETNKPDWWPNVAGPVALFWGLIDRRLDVQWCRSLSWELGRRGGCLVLAGPQQDPDPGVVGLSHTLLAGAVAYDRLPAIASWADVLVMPYVDAPVTRAMQPLKFKEYLATGRPVIVRDLPATAAWGDCCDVAADEGEFTCVCLKRARGGMPETQRRGRDRKLPGKSWSEKAREFAGLWTGRANTPMKQAA